MANTYFQFKKFIVQQDRCAMKVCTDACIFGAWVAGKIGPGKSVVNNLLDIGTGTGLLSLMIAQKTGVAIDAVEIDEAAFQQAKQNFDQSQYVNQLNIYHADALFFNPEKKYDCIISNPPFFEDDLRSGDKKKNVAKHDLALTLEQLLLVIIKHLSPYGFFSVLIPFHRTNYFIGIASAAGYYLNEQLLVKHSKEHLFFRSILLFSRNNKMITSNELAIKNGTGNYTGEFTALLKDYYLHL